MITVAHVVENLDVGGLERVVISLIEATDKKRYRAILYALGGGGVLARELEARAHGVRRLARRPGIDGALLLRMARHLRADRVDVVHCHNYSPLVYGSCAGRLAGVSGVIYTAHGAKTASRRATRWFQRMRLVDDIVFVSDDARRVSLAAGAVRDKRLHTVPNGVDVAAYERGGESRLRVRAQMGIEADAAVVGIVARLTAAKDHGNLFAAFERVQRTHPDARCVVVGDGELADELAAQLRERGLASSILMIGPRHDIPDVLSTFDVFVLSSYTEGLPVTLLEAMAAGLPVVATRVGGNPEVVVDGETGVLVPPRDPEALAGALGQLLSEPERARAMGRRGRDRCNTVFGLGVMTASYEALYERLTGDDDRSNP